MKMPSVVWIWKFSQACGFAQDPEQLEVLNKPYKEYDPYLNADELERRVDTINWNYANNGNDDAAKATAKIFKLIRKMREEKVEPFPDAEDLPYDEDQDRGDE